MARVGPFQSAFDFSGTYWYLQSGTMNSSMGISCSFQYAAFAFNPADMRAYSFDNTSGMLYVHQDTPCSVSSPVVQCYAYKKLSLTQVVGMAFEYLTNRLLMYAEFLSVLPQSHEL